MLVIIWYLNQIRKNSSSWKDFQDSVFLWDFLGKTLRPWDAIVKTVESSSEKGAVEMFQKQNNYVNNESEEWSSQ